MAARRLRKTNRGVADFELLLNAIKAIKIEKKTLRSTALVYEIDKRSLSRYIKKLDVEVPDISVVGDDELLNVLQRVASYDNTSKAHMVCSYEYLTRSVTAIFCSFIGIRS